MHAGTCLTVRKASLDSFRPETAACISRRYTARQLPMQPVFAACDGVGEGDWWTRLAAHIVPCAGCKACDKPSCGCCMPNYATHISLLPAEPDRCCCTCTTLPTRHSCLPLAVLIHTLHCLHVRAPADHPTCSLAHCRFIIQHDSSSSAAGLVFVHTNARTPILILHSSAALSSPALPAISVIHCVSPVGD